MLYIIIPEFKTHSTNYIRKLANNDSITITRYKKVVAVFSFNDIDYYKNLFSLCGCLKKYDTGEDYKTIIGDGIMEKYGLN